MNIKVIIICCMMMASMVLSGCMENRASYSQRNFALQANRDLPVAKDSKDIVLSVQSFNSSTLYGTKEFVYKISQSEYETDFYNQFLVTPADMLTEITRSWLSDSGIFKLVLEPGVYSNATAVLEGNLFELYGDFRDKDAPKANLKIRFFVVDSSDKSVLYTNTYEASSVAKDNSIESLVDAFDKSLVEILSKLEKDLQENL